MIKYRNVLHSSFLATAGIVVALVVSLSTGLLGPYDLSHVSRVVLGCLNIASARPRGERVADGHIYRETAQGALQAQSRSRGAGCWRKTTGKDGG